MAEHLHYDDGDITNVETRHETSDVNVRALIWFGVIVVIFAVITHFLVYFIYRSFVVEERHQSKKSGVLTEVARPADAAVPKNQPLLQPFPRKDGATGNVQVPYRDTPVTDLAALRDAEQKVLTSYGWVDQQKGIVRMPIDVAMQLTLQRGLPVQQQMPAPAVTGMPGQITMPNSADSTGGESPATVRARHSDMPPPVAPAPQPQGVRP